jgi:hypothetical protein
MGGCCTPGTNSDNGVGPGGCCVCGCCDVEGWAAECPCGSCCSSDGGGRGRDVLEEPAAAGAAIHGQATGERGRGGGRGGRLGRRER